MTNLPPIFVGDAPGLDFLNSIATPIDVPVDWIGDGDGYLRWLQEARLAPEEVLREARARARPGELDQVADQARDLREWFREFVRRHMGRALTGAALGELAPLNQLLQRDQMFSRIVAQPGQQKSLVLQSEHRWPDAGSLLLPVGAAMAELICDQDFSLVKACEGPTCTLLFADHTRGHARRWCSMAICGNRAKQAAHRHRLKAQKH